ncbi:MAG: hypothetical protein WBX00_24300 [Isosphaeraceae bacterium]
MFRTIAKQRHCRPGLEPLEARELLSGRSSIRAIVGRAATPDATVSITLHLAGSTATAGDYVDVASKYVVLTGQTAAGATVVLRQALASGKLRTFAKTHADAQGAYQLKINCGMGTTQLTAQVVEATGVASSTTLSVTRASQAIVWNSIALQAVRTADLQAPDASRVRNCRDLGVRRGQRGQSEICLIRQRQGIIGVSSFFVEKELTPITLHQ